MAVYNVFDFLKSVPEFDGKTEDLPLFITYIEEVRQYAEGPQLVLFDLKIRHKIVGKANIALINNNNPMKWEEIKSVLQTNFTITESIESIINKIKTADIRNTIDNFYEYIMSLLTKLNLKANVNNDETWYTCENNEKMVLRIFINKLPGEPKLILNARNPSSLLAAKEILVETDYFYRNFNSKNQKGRTLTQSLSSQNAGRDSNFNENTSNNNNRGGMRFQGSSQSRNSGDRSGHSSGGSRQFNREREENFNRQRDNEDSQIPMELGIVRPSNFQSTAEDLFPI